MNARIGKREKKKIAGLVSIIVTNYNSNDTLEYTLCSIALQTYKDWECIIVDDGSKEPPKKLVEAMRDKRFRLVCHEINKGRAVARQTGLDNAVGEYLTAVDSDDWIYPKKLSVQVEIMKRNPDVDIVSCGMAITDKLMNIRKVRRGRYVREGMNVNMYYTRPAIPNAPSLVRIEVARSVGYDRQYPYAEDMVFLSRAIRGRRYLLSRDPLYSYYENKQAILKKKLLVFSHQEKYVMSLMQMQPVIAIYWLLRLKAKKIAWKVLIGLGLGELTIDKQSDDPTGIEVREHKKNLKRVRELRNRIYG